MIQDLAQQLRRSDLIPGECWEMNDNAIGTGSKEKLQYSAIHKFRDDCWIEVAPARKYVAKVTTFVVYLYWRDQTVSWLQCSADEQGLSCALHKLLNDWKEQVAALSFDYGTVEL